MLNALVRLVAFLTLHTSRMRIVHAIEFDDTECRIVWGYAMEDIGFTVAEIWISWVPDYQSAWFPKLLMKWEAVVSML
jgi:hypothetical protein